MNTQAAAAADTRDGRISRNQLQLMIDAMPGAFLAVDQARTVHFVSGEIPSLFGYAPEELIGEPLDKLVPESLRLEHANLHAAYCLAPAARPMGSGRAVHGRTRDGRVVPLDIGLSPIATTDGPLILAAIHDLRPLREGEERLRQARDEADRANKAKSRFLAAASHDLRQPLQTMSLLHGYLEKRLDQPAESGIFAKLTAAVSQMSELLDTLLDINQIENGAIRPDITDIVLADLLGALADEFAPVAADKGLELRLVSSSAVVRSDRRLLARMVGNLLSNAIKYTERGKVLLGCRRDGAALRLEVWDTGVGIPTADHDAIFEAFYRVDRHNGDKLGLGLGLAIVQQFAQLLGHRVEVVSTPGKGACFAIVIADPVHPAAVPSHRLSGARGDNGPPSVLLVEDDAGQLEVLKLILELDGYAVTAERRGDDAIARLRAASPLRPDFVVADYNLPGGPNGLDVIAEARLAAGVALPAMIVSGDRRRDILSAVDLAGVAFIPKPVKTADLLAEATLMAKAAKPAGRRVATVIGQSSPARANDATVAIIDDDPGVRDALRMMLESRGHRVAAYPSGEAFLADGRRGQYRCLVVDIDLPVMTGLQLQGRLKTERIVTPIIFITGQSHLPLAVQAMRDGAADFLQKPVSGETLDASVVEALEQDRVSVRSAAADADVAARWATLTEREREVMERVVAGVMNKNIAAELGISQRTTEHHRQSVMRKMGVNSLARLVLLAGARGRQGDGLPTLPA